MYIEVHIQPIKDMYNVIKIYLTKLFSSFSQTTALLDPLHQVPLQGHETILS